MQFDGECRELHVGMDTKPPIGKGQGLTPKELVALGIGGCTAMDVVALLKKYKQPATTFHVDTDVEQTSGTHPAVFATVKIRFHAEGKIEKEKKMLKAHSSCLSRRQQKTLRLPQLLPCWRIVISSCRQWPTAQCQRMRLSILLAPLPSRRWKSTRGCRKFTPRLA